MKLKDRIEDKTKTPLSESFVKFIRHVAEKNDLSEDEIYLKWRVYSGKCEAYDQSPTLPEFLSWMKLEADKIEYPDGTWCYVGGAC